jgi:hypothetical protein
MGGSAAGLPSDTFALGVTLRELADSVEHGSEATSGRERDTAHSALEHTADRAMADDPAERPTAGQIAAALGAVARVVEPTHRPTIASNEASSTAVIAGPAAATAVIPKVGATTALPTTPGVGVDRAAGPPAGGGRPPGGPRRPALYALLGLLIAAGLAGLIIAVSAGSNGTPAPASPKPSVTAPHIRTSPSPSHRPPTAAPPPAKGHGKGHKKHHGGGNHQGGD